MHRGVCDGDGDKVNRRRTLELGNIHAELVPLLQHSLAPLFNKGVELGGELGHAIAKVVEAKVDTRQCVGERRADGRTPCRMRRLEDRCHCGRDCCDIVCMDSCIFAGYLYTNDSLRGFRMRLLLECGVVDVAS